MAPAAAFQAARGPGPAPAPPEAHFRHILSSADLLREQGRLGEAEGLLRLALRVRPGSVPACNALGMVLFETGHMDDALAAFRHAARLDPDAAAAWGNAGMVLKTLDRFDEAFHAYDRALALDPLCPQLRLNRSIALLRAGRMAAAWPDYECRHALPGGAPALSGALLPDLSTAAAGGAAPDLRGRTVLVTHEEGFGDTLQFVRYVPMLAALGARVLLAVPRELRRLLADMPGIAALADPAAPPAADYVCPFFSLPRAFGTTLDTIPAAIPYLRAAPALVDRWAASVACHDSARLKVGLVWAGQARPWLPGFTTLDRRRSAGAAAFGGLAGLPVDFVSLQANAAEHPPGLALADPMGAVRDFADTAALIASLDVVVSVDTSVVHLAGGMGKPVLMLDRFDACWRWLSGRTDSPWYPSLRIFRQPNPGNWDDPMRGVADALRAMADAKCAVAAGAPAAACVTA